MDEGREQEMQSVVGMHLARLQEQRNRMARGARGSAATEPAAEVEAGIAKAHDDLWAQVAAVLRDTDEQLAGLVARAARSAGVDRERLETAHAALQCERDALEHRAAALRDATATTWGKAKDEFELSIRGLWYLREKGAAMLN